MDKKTNVLIGIIIILAIMVAYQAATRNTTKPATPQPIAMTDNFMQAHIPVSLTDQQKAQLKAGSDTHTPTNLTFNITGGSFYFVPNEIRVKQGDTVTIIFNDVGGMHNFNLDAFNVKTKTINTGESDTVTFTANKKGTFEFYCAVGNGYHRMQGQIGALLVE